MKRCIPIPIQCDFITEVTIYTLDEPIEDPRFILYGVKVDDGDGEKYIHMDGIERVSRNTWQWKGWMEVWSEPFICTSILTSNTEIKIEAVMVTFMNVKNKLKRNQYRFQHPRQFTQDVFHGGVGSITPMKQRRGIEEKER